MVALRTDERPAHDDTLDAIVDRLTAALSPAAIWLFGSRARGDAAVDSDYDVLVLVDDTVTPTLDLEMQAVSALWGIRAPVDVCVWRRTDFEATRSLRASLPGTVVREGRLLRAA